jgi:hypothetical protein
MTTIPMSWLQEQISLDVIEMKLEGETNHPNWQKLKRLAQKGDEFWLFRSPPATWPKKLGAMGYALVREGKPIASFTIVRS